MFRKVFRIALIAAALVMITATSAFAQARTAWPIKVIVSPTQQEVIEFTQFPVHKVVAPRGMAYLELQSRTGERSRVRFDQFPTGYAVEVPEVHAGLDLVCGGMTYTVKTGNNRGTCFNNGDSVDCADSKGNTAGASCENGCEGSSGAGSCSAKPTGS